MAEGFGSQIGSLYVRIGVDQEALKSGLANARSSLASFGSAAKSAASIAVAGFAAAAAAITAAGAALVSFTRSAADGAAKIQNLSRLANASAEEFQRFAYAAKTVGLEQEKVADILKDVNDKIGDFRATGGGAMADFFENIAPKVNVTAEAFRNLSGPQALQLYYDSLQKAGASQADMTFYMEALANDATALIPLLRDGGAALRKFGDEAQRAGAVLSDADRAKLVEVRNIFLRFSAVLEGIKNQIAVSVAPVIAELADKFQTGAIDARKFGEWTFEAMRGIAVGAAQVIDVFQRLNPVIQGMRTAIAAIGVVQANVAAAMVKHIGGTIDFLTSKINLLISAINKIPGVNIEFRIPQTLESDFVRGVNNAAARAGEAFNEAWQALMNSTDFELVTPKVRQFFEDARNRALDLTKTLEGVGNRGGSGLSTASKKADELKQKLEELRETVAKLGMTEDQAEMYDLRQLFGSDPRAAEAIELLGEIQLDRMRKLNEEKLAELDRYLASETELEIKAHQERMQILNELYEAERISDEERKLYQRDLEEKHQQTLTEIQRRALEERQKYVKYWADYENSMRASVVQNGVALLDQFAGKSKAAALAAIALNKALMIAQTIQSTAAAQMRALAELGPIAGSAMAAKIGAWGAVNVGIIAATGLAQAAGALSSSGSLAGGASASVGGNSAAPSPAQPAAPTAPVITINLEGESYGRKQIVELISKINEAVGDGARLRVT